MEQTRFVAVNRSAQLFFVAKACTHVIALMFIVRHVCMDMGGPGLVLGIEQENSSGDENKDI